MLREQCRRERLRHIARGRRHRSGRQASAHAPTNTAPPPCVPIAASTPMHTWRGASPFWAVTVLEPRTDTHTKRSGFLSSTQSRVHKCNDALHGERSRLGRRIANETFRFALVERELDFPTTPPVACHEVLQMRLGMH